MNQNCIVAIVKDFAISTTDFLKELLSKSLELYGLPDRMDAAKAEQHGKCVQKADG